MTGAGLPSHDGSDRRDELGNDDREAVEHLVDGHDGTMLPRCLRTKHGWNHVRPALKRVTEELIGRFDSDAMGIAGLRREVAKVGRHDDIRLSGHGYSTHASRTAEGTTPGP